MFKTEYNKNKNKNKENIFESNKKKCPNIVKTGVMKSILVRL